MQPLHPNIVKEMLKKLSKEELEEYNQLLATKFQSLNGLTKEQEERLEELFQKLDYPKLPDISK